MIISETITNLESITLSCDWVFDIESIQPSKPPLSSILEDIVKLVHIIKDALKELEITPLLKKLDRISDKSRRKSQVSQGCSWVD